MLYYLSVQRNVHIEGFFFKITFMCSVFTDMNRDPAEGRVLSLNSWSEGSVQQSLVPNPTIPLPEYSSPMPHLVQEPIPYTSTFLALLMFYFTNKRLVFFRIF